jgi:uncharacterized Tic20 family protein
MIAMDEETAKSGDGALEDEGSGGGIEKTGVAVPSEKDERMWGMLTHLSALSALIGVPFGNILGPLLIWLFKKDTIPSIDAQGKAALNFQISMTIYGTVLFSLGVLTLWILIGLLFLFGALVVGVVWVVCTLIAAVKANEGERYEYPFTLQFLR